MAMLRDMNVSVNGRRDSTDSRVGVLASEIPTGFALAPFLLNDIDSAFPNRLYSMEILTLPSAGQLVLKKNGTGTFTGAPDGTYTGTERVEKFDPGVGRVSSETVNYSLVVGSGTSSDTVAPVMNGAITVSSVTTSGFTLTWQAATDAVGVTGYEYSINGGTSYISNGTSLTVSVTGRQASTAHQIRVRAFDAAGNRATPLSATATTSAPAGDTTAPVMQGALSVSGVGSTSATLGWQAATDAVGVTGYEVSTNGGTSYANAGNVTSLVLNGLTPETAYQVRVRAYDAAGNRSTPLSASFTTLAAVVVPATYQLTVAGPAVRQHTVKPMALRLALVYTDTPAPKSRTIVLGGSSTAITAG